MLEGGIMKVICCNKCKFAEFRPGKGNPGRYYCKNPDAKFARSECEPVPMICRTGRHDSDFTIKTSPKWCPLRKETGLEPEEIEKKGQWVMVTDKFGFAKWEECSECAYPLKHIGAGKNMNYCPRCGAKMKWKEMT